LRDSVPRTSPYDTIHEAIRTIAAGVGNEDETVTAATVALDASRNLDEGWQGLAMGLLNVSMILIADR
jgi:hypothetical protein